MRPDYVTTRYGNDSSSLSQQADVIVVRLFAVLGHTLNVPYLGRHHLGFRQFRVRIHGTMARIEVPAEEILKIADNETRTKITEKFHTVGFSYVTLDLQGFRSGSMNETLGK